MQKGSKQSPEAIEKMRKAKLGKHISEETKEKMRIAQLSPETLERNRRVHLGKKLSEETKKKMSESHIGEKNGFFGRRHSEETKEKMRVAKTPECRLKMSESKKGIIPANIEILKVSCLGKPMSEEHYENHSKAMGSKETRDKMSLAQRGEKNPNWNNGVTPLYKQIRDCAKYSEWRDAVFKRDNYCDVITGEKGNGDLNAHHVIPFASILEKYNITTFEEALLCEALWDVDNGITMLEKNHVAYHSRTGSPE